MRDRQTPLVDGQRGFTMVELMLALGVVAIVLTTSLPLLLNSQRTYRLMNDTRTIADQLTMARVRAASEFTQVRLNFNLNNGSYQLQLWDKTNSNFDLAEGGTQYLSGAINFSFGGISTPAGSQTTIQESPQIIFNSRGVAVDNTGAATGNYAVYLRNDEGQTSAVTVSASGKVNIWRWNGSAWRAY